MAKKAHIQANFAVFVWNSAFQTNINTCRAEKSCMQPSP